MTYPLPEIITEYGQTENHTNYGAMSISTYTYERGYYRDIEFAVGERIYRFTEEDIEEMGEDRDVSVGDWIGIPEFVLAVKIGDEVTMEHFDRYPNGDEEEGLTNIAKRIDELLAQGGKYFRVQRYDGVYHGVYNGVQVNG